MPEAGNHVRKVFQPLEHRVKSIEIRLDAMQKGQEDILKGQEELKELMMKLTLTVANIINTNYQ